MELTPKGRRLIERAFRQHAQHLESAMSVLDEEERRHLRAGLKKLGKSVAATLDRPHAKGTYE
jgi:DNA-binding MarR family transcriptional regulator